MLELDLPLPPEPLYPNSRTRNHNYFAKLVKSNRATVAMLAKVAKPHGAPFDALILQPVFYMPRRRDADNLLAWIKSTQDGLQDAGWVRNDSTITLLPPKQVTGKLAGRKLILQVVARPI